MKKFYLLIITVLLINISNAQNRNYGDTTWVDSINFESPYLNLSIDTSQQNIWQIGVPSQTILDSAYSPIHAIMTDTANNYPVNNYSYFDVTLIRDYAEPVFMHWYLGVSIRHRYNTDTLKDGGFLSISIDQGQTFVNVIEDWSSPYGMPPEEWGPMGPSNIYSIDDTLINGHYGFSGNSNGWVTSGFSWYNMIVKNLKSWGDTAILRFNFISDSVNTNKEGWLIDDIRFYWVDIGGKINETINNAKCRIFPNPTKGIVSIQNTENSIQNIGVYDIYGREVLKTEVGSQKTEVDLNSQPKGIYFVKVRTERGVVIEKVVLN